MLQATLHLLPKPPSLPHRAYHEGTFVTGRGPWAHGVLFSQNDGESVVAYVVRCTCPVLLE